ncbi:MAG: Ppx/GppA phosphatase family protein, partial [Phenylobacterium sp.]|nr:Ppx/GppA phosphatase family protein [Phenylobacterium sp.]
LPATGRLSAPGVELALAILRRFRVVLDSCPTDDVTVVGTAAVREAEDGPEFVARVRQETGFEIRVLSGQEEARYAALGVIAGHPDAEGVAGDLGGSSLELVPVSRGAPGAGLTLPLGPFALGAPKPLNPNKARKLIDQRLAPLARSFRAPNFYAVGGAWRNLALLQMALGDYPLRVAHEYEMSRADALDAARFIQRQSEQSLERIPGVSKKRFETLPHAALVLDALIEHLEIETIIVSAYGVREGLLLESMPPEVRGRDPLIEGCEALTALRGLSAELGPALECWLAPVFDELAPMFGARDRLLLAAACRLADLGARLHPDHRAELAFNQVLRAPIAGMNHCERTFLACAVFSRHTTQGTPPETAVVNRVLTPERRQRARALGAAIRLGADLSGRNPALLAATRLRINGNRLVLSAEPATRAVLQGEQTPKRAATLAQALKLKLELG